eukprot:Nitzschia sp. Nitz4//scaffold993_size270//4//219//NITZ4_009340-RA/size270-exonerate_protein2genome-gene-0.0-mRNA-1//-1//CDS//3329560803//5248//frame0
MVSQINCSVSSATPLTFSTSQRKVEWTLESMLEIQVVNSIQYWKVQYTWMRLPAYHSLLTVDSCTPHIKKMV